MSDSTQQLGDQPEPSPGAKAAGEAAPPSRRGPAGHSRTPAGRHSPATSTSSSVALAQRDDYLALAQRTQADFENFRKRVARDAAAAQERGVAGLAKELLPALDNLDRALEAADEGDPLLQGVKLAREELAAGLARVGVESFCPTGEPFDPEVHEAVATAPQEPGGSESGTVVEVYQLGYRLGSSVHQAGARGRGGIARENRWQPVPTTTRRSGSTRRRARRRSRRPTANSRASTTRTATRTTRAPRRASRRSRRRTTCSATPRSAASTTAERGQFTAGAGPGGGFGGFGNFDFDAASMGDILSNLFGGSASGRRVRTKPRAEKGTDLEAQVSITFDQAIAGAQVPLQVPMRSGCTACRGTGAKSGTTPSVCPRCEGRGIETQGQGMFSISQPCSQCGGAGTVIEDPCPVCGGTGAVRTVKRLRVNIPAGVKDGSRIRIAGKGEPGRNGGPAGDLYLITHVSPSSLFTRKGDNLEVEVPLTIPEAISGAEVKVPTLNGTKTLRVKPGTAHGTVQRLRGEGPPKLGSKPPSKATSTTAS